MTRKLEEILNLPNVKEAFQEVDKKEQARANKDSTREVQKNVDPKTAKALQASYEEFDKIEKVDDEFRYYGTIYLPNLTISGKVISGKLYGYISYHTISGFISPEFYKSENGKDYDIFDFCGGFEYELDSFLEYVIYEIEQK